MRVLLWLFCIMSVVGIFSADHMHELFAGTKFYDVAEPTILQVVLGVLAGILATKASDSSREIRSLLRIGKIDALLGEAQTAEERAGRNRRVNSSK